MTNEQEDTLNTYQGRVVLREINKPNGQDPQALPARARRILAHAPAPIPATSQVEVRLAKLESSMENMLASQARSEKKTCELLSKTRELLSKANEQNSKAYEQSSKALEATEKLTTTVDIMQVQLCEIQGSLDQLLDRFNWVPYPPLGVAPVPTCWQQQQLVGPFPPPSFAPAPAYWQPQLHAAPYLPFALVPNEAHMCSQQLRAPGTPSTSGRAPHPRPARGRVNNARAARCRR
jgi:hypothetical protein